MIKQRIYVLLIMLLTWAPLSGVQAQQKDTLNVLFIGNSYTYFWNLPQTVVTMAAEKGIPLKARKSTAGGTSLKQHWEGDKNLKSRELITNHSWDVVIIQNHSMSTVNNYDEFMEYGKKFIDLVRESGATPLLYMTWARESNPLMQAAVSKGYRTLADQEEVLLAPVGEVWEKSRQLKPNFRLYDPDGSHPSTIGTYLTALVFFRVLTGEETQGIPKRLATIDKNGEQLFYSIMSEDNIIFMQQLVDSLELNSYASHDQQR